MSSAHGSYRRSMKPPAVVSKPSPAQDGWLLLAACRPSTDCEEYARPTDGAGPPGGGGTRIGYDQAKFPELPPAVQVDETCSGVAPKSPAGPDGPSVTATRADAVVAGAPRPAAGRIGTVAVTVPDLGSLRDGRAV